MKKQRWALERERERGSRDSLRQDRYFVTLVERVTKLLVVRRTKSKKKEVSKTIKEMMIPFKSLCHNITFNNGGEFTGHEDIKKHLK